MKFGEKSKEVCAKRIAVLEETGLESWVVKESADVLKDTLTISVSPVLDVNTTGTFLYSVSGSKLIYSNVLPSIVSLPSMPTVDI